MNDSVLILMERVGGRSQELARGVGFPSAIKCIRLAY